MGGIRRSAKGSREFSIGDLRRVERKGFPNLSSIIELFCHLPVNIQNEQPVEKVWYTEVDIPRALTTLAPGPTGLSGLLRPEQKMRNWIQRECTEGLAKIPPYTPYLAPRLSSSPWLPDVTDHRNIHDYRAKNSRQAKRKLSPQELPAQGWLLYRLRFLMDGERCSAFAPFDALCAPLNLISVAPNLCVTENVGIWITYFKILRSKLADSARRRIIAPAEFSGLLSVEQLGVKEQARRELALAARGSDARGNPDIPPTYRAQNENRPNRPTFNSGASASSTAPHNAPPNAPPRTQRSRRDRQNFRTQQ